MKVLSLTSVLSAALILAPMAGIADPKPKGTKRANAQEIANTYAGRTQDWKDCNGGIYYGAKWQAQAYCNKNGEAVGLGTWKVKGNGSVCQTLTWYWPQDGGYGSKPEGEKCIKHVAGQDGKVWRNFDGDADWWGLNSDSLKNGFKLKGKINRLRRKMGV